MRALFTALVLAFAVAPAAARQFRVPEGFRVEDAASISEPFVAMTFGPDGAVLLSVENGPLLRLTDSTGDGRFDAVSTFCDELRSCQGIAWHEGRVFATGKREGEPGLFRITPTNDGTRAQAVELMIGVHGFGEHGAHAVAPGPDGRLWVVVGNHSYFTTAPEPGSALTSGYDGNLLPTYDDPNGHAIGKAYPAGFVARVDPETGAWSYQSTGYRNPYDLAFDASGQPFTCDADMEWDVGLPWYRPVRVVHAQPGADFGWRTGSGKWRAWYADSLPAVVDVGRGSPTGVAFYQAERYPERYRGAFLVADWSEGRILAVHLAPDGAGWSGEVEALVQAEGELSVTDLEVGPDGLLYFTSGGRGVPGRLQRLVFESEPGPTPADAVAQALRQPQPWSAWGRAATQAARARAGDSWVPALERAVQDAGLRARERVRALWLLEAASGPASRALLKMLIEDDDASVRAAAAERLAGKGGRAWIPLWRSAFDDPDARVRRAVCAAVWEDPSLVWPYRVRVAWQLAHPDRRVRAQARAALERGPMFARPESVTATSDRERAEWALLAARHPDTVARKNAFWFEAKQLLYGPRSGPEEKLDALRAIALALDRFELAPPEKLHDEVRFWVLETFPSGDARMDNELAILLAHWEPEGAVEQLLDALAAEPDSVRQIHYAYCLHRMMHGWTGALRKRLFTWFEATNDWTGGASLPGYLAVMRDTFVDGVPVEECLAMAAAGEASAHTLALFLGQLEPEQAAPLVASLRTSWAALPTGERGTVEHAAKSRVLRALVGVEVPGLPELLRELFAADGSDHEALWIALAELADEQDFPVLMQGLATPAGTVREACADALIEIGRVPDDPAVWRGVFAAGARFGWPRGNVHLGLLAAWRGEGGGAETQDAWPETLDYWEGYLSERWPDSAPEHTSAPARPVWDAGQITDFLQRSGAREGSARRGADVFVRATCSTCHAVGDWKPPVPLTGWGPDLAGVTNRFATPELVETIASPSLFVSDQHRIHVVTTTNDERLTGRLVADDESGVTFLADDGERLFVARDEVGSLDPSDLSSMPDGLFAPLTLEEIKDLFAFLAAEQPGPGAVPDWTPLFGRAGSRLEPGSEYWTVADGVLIGASAGIAPSDYLWSRNAYGDFEVELDVRVTPGGNSGLQYRTHPGAGPDPIGYQVDVGQRYWGSLFASDGRGTLADADTRLPDVLDPAGWNHVYLRVVGDRHTIEVNGLTTVQFRDAEHTTGQLAFQLHQGPPMEVRFANARIRALD